MAGLGGLCTGLLFSTAALGFQPLAQPPAAQPDEAFEGRPIREVLVLKPGAEGALVPVGATLDQLARNQIRTEAGRPYRRQTVLDDISRLNRLGRFRMVESSVRGFEDGSVAVTYTLVEQPTIVDIQSVGNRLLSDQEILDSVGALAGTPVDRFQIDRAARQIEDLYRRKGYYLAKVDVDEGELEESGILLFRVREGERVKVTDIRFEGNTSFSARELRSTIKTQTADLLFETGPLDDDVLASDVAALVAYYRDRGRLDVRADRRVLPSPDNKEAIVTFVVDEGPMYTLRGVRARFLMAGDVEADQGRFTTEQLAGLMTIKAGDVYSSKRLDESLEAIEQAYGKLGYADMRLVRREVRDVEKPEVDLLLFIREGRPFTTGSVEIIGNPLTSHEVIARQIQVKPERPLDNTAIKETERRLEQLRIFEPGSVKVTVQPEDPELAGYRDVLVEVAETNTGEFNFGVGVTSDAGLLGRFAVQQRNFDLFNTPDSFDDLWSGGAFRGGGQTLALELQPGDRLQVYSLSLTEPYLFETNTSIRGDAYFRNRIYREYDEERYGGRLVLGRRFGYRWSGAVTLRNEWVSLDNIDADAPVDIFDVASLSLINAVGLELTRNTTDDRLRPGKGTRLVFSVEQVGAVVGDFDFTKFGADYAAFFTLNETFAGEKTILSANARVAYIPQDTADVPTYERYYLGGSSFRGFAHRAVSPLGLRGDGSVSDVPVGGTWLFFLGAQLEQPVYQDIVSVVGFVDTGTVSDEIGVDEYRVSVGTGLRLRVTALSPIPLAFDFGFPILKQDGDRTRIFTFSLDVPF